MTSYALTPSMVKRVWTLAQFKHGWHYASDDRTYRALERRGLVRALDDRRQGFALTDAGRAEAAKRWSDTPFTNGTYDPPPWGWPPVKDQEPFYPGISCYTCGRFVGRDGNFEVTHFEMSSTIASIEGECRRCIDRRAAERQAVAA